MDLEVAVKIIAVVASGLGAWKVLAEMLRGQNASRRDEYNFAKQFLSDLQSKPPLHPYLRDKGYEALGGTKLSTREIEYLISLPEPAKSLREYALGRQYLDHLATAGQKQLVVRNRYRPMWKMRSLLYFYLALFLLAYAAAASPLLFHCFFKCLVFASRLRCC